MYIKYKLLLLTVIIFFVLNI